MPVSDREFLRWNSRNVSSWPFLVFQKHNAELSHMFISQQVAQEYVYKQLGRSGTSWEDHPNTKFPFNFENGMYKDTFKTVRLWSDSYHSFENWNNLNTLMAMSSNLETYMAAVVQLALESDIGVLYGASRKIDGVTVLKYGREKPFDFNNELISCTKGNWQSRVSSFERFFGRAPNDLIAGISLLEKVRKLRNDVGHAFGRDINESRAHNYVQVLKMKRLSRKNVIKFMKEHNKIAKSIDRQLMQDNIGEYQAVHFYHHNKDSFRADISTSQKKGMHIAELKKKIGSYSGNSAGKKFCRGLVDYYWQL